MKLKFNNSVSKTPLREADADAGACLIYVEKVYKELKTAVENAGFKFKPASDASKGFYILLPNKYLGKFSINLNTESDTVSLKFIDFKNDELLASEPPVESLGKLTFDSMINDAKDAFIPNLTKIATESLDEDLLLEYGPFDKLKGAINKFASNMRDKQQVSQDKKNSETKFSDNIPDAKENFEAAVESIGLVGNSKIAKNSAEFTIMPVNNTYLTVALAMDPKNVKNVIVKNVITADNKKVTIDADLDNFLKTLYKAIGLADVNKVVAAENDAEAEFAGTDDDSIEAAIDQNNAARSEKDKSLTKPDKLTASEFKKYFDLHSDEFKGMDSKDLSTQLAKVFGKESTSLFASVDSETLLKVAAKIGSK